MTIWRFGAISLLIGIIALGIAETRFGLDEDQASTFALVAVGVFWTLWLIGHIVRQRSRSTDQK
jgi:hypothetical protein